MRTGADMQELHVMHIAVEAGCQQDSAEWSSLIPDRGSRFRSDGGEIDPHDAVLNHTSIREMEQDLAGVAAIGAVSQIDDPKADRVVMESLHGHGHVTGVIE